MLEVTPRPQTPELDQVDRRLLNGIQADFPLASRPFAALGERFGCDEQEVIKRLGALKRRRIIRQISAIFDTRSMGYRSSLVAMRVEPGRVERAARVINTHPGVTHNYERNHEFNLWFTVAVPPTMDLQRHVDRLHALAGALSTRILQTIRLFKIAVQLDMTGEESATAQAEPLYGDHRRPKQPRELDAVEVGVVRELQEDLPLEPAPFAPMAERLGIGEEELFARARALQDEGLLRRFAAILYHRKAGFRANAMGVWKVDPEAMDRIGPMVASFKAVSHCYQRPIYADWPYNLFSMIHGRSKDECEEIIAAIALATGLTDYAALYSTREYKKTRVRYYTPEYEQWEARHLSA
ncbi:MAG: Lrp/AsnC family transcriptional regulator [Chloroflexi bacterium]|nr:Lrp/AsnC family transcriptional regulator [Chloroflexota bacterium]